MPEMETISHGRVTENGNMQYCVQVLWVSCMSFPLEMLLQTMFPYSCSREPISSSCILPDSCGTLKIALADPPSSPQAQDWLESLDLGHMTHLHLSLHPVNKGTLQCLGRCLRGAPEMQMVKVTATGVEAGWTQGILSMPYRGKYEFRYDEYEEGLGQVADKLAEQGFVLPCEDGPPYYMYDRMIRFKCPTIGHGEAATDDFNLSADFLSDESV